MRPLQPSFVERSEWWLPIAAGLFWWVAMYPGLFGEDSLITLGDVRSGHITLWFGAWWEYVIKVLTFNTRAIPIITLAGVVLLAWSVRVWSVSVFPPGRARAWATLLICASPLVGAIGIQLRHDAWMTSGLLLVTAMMAKLARRGDAFSAASALPLIAAVPLIATRHNGWPTLLLSAGAVALWFGKQNRRLAGALLAASALSGGLGLAAAWMAGHDHTIDPAQAVEWTMADVSCLLTKAGVEPTAEEWTMLETTAARGDWPQPVACRFVNPIFAAPSFHPERIQPPGFAGIPSVWASLARRHPVKMAAAHFGRLSLFLPPFVTGAHPQTPFIHSTILPNNLGLSWAFPELVALMRLPARAWNAARLILANATVWLAVLLLAVMRRADLAAGLRPALVFGVIIEAVLLVTAPVSEGRYALLILVTGQLTLIYLLLERWTTAR